MATPSADEIIERVHQQSEDTQSLRLRFEKDYGRYRLDKHVTAAGFKTYTSNAPMVYADKIASWLNSAQLLLQIPSEDRQRQDREASDSKERFLLGCLRSADERLARLVLPSVREQLAWHTVVRGWYAGRALIAKTKRGESYVDIMPWDPLHTYWGMGSDGIDWACYKTKKSHAAIKAQYGVDLPDSRWEQRNYGSSALDGLSDTRVGLDVYDYYDAETNTVVVEGAVLKKAAAHGSPRTPVFIGAVGTAPLVLTNQETADISLYGPSVFKAIGELSETFNEIMSIWFELVSRARKPPIVVGSRDGRKKLENDPYVTGSELALAEGEHVEALKLLEMTRDAAAFVGIVSGELQRGTLPHSAYGELAFALSGFAITQLRQGIDAPLQPRLRAVENAYLQICNLLTDQYLTGAFAPMRLSGYHRNRQYFEATITPDEVLVGGDPEISLMPDLPQDDMAKVSMAQMLREGPTPLMPDGWIRSKTLGVQDADRLEDAVKEQIGERMLPEAALWTVMTSLENRGRPDLAKFYWGQLAELVQQKLATFGGGGNGAVPGGNGAVPGGPPGLNPQAMPNAAMGLPPPRPVPQGGPNVPPGSPRPGSMTPESRLTRMGLVGPNA